MINTIAGKTICHLSFNHSPFDDRIYWKELLSIRKAGYNAVHIAVGNENSDFISAEGIRVITIKRKKLLKFRPVNSLLQLIFKRKGTLGVMLDKATMINADVYHYHDHQVNAIVPYLKKLKQLPALVYDDHEPLELQEVPEGSFKKTAAGFLKKMLLAWELKHASLCDYIIATDQYTYNYYEKKLPSVKKTIIYNYSYFIPSKLELTIKKEFHFMYAGLISTGRGIKEFLEALSLLRSDIPEVKALLIGPFENEELRNEISRYISENEMSGNVIVKDPVPFSEMQDHYSRSMVGIGLFHDTPKFNNFVPIKLFEYMAFGLPVIFSDHGPSADIIRENDCGILVTVPVIKNIAAAMKCLLQDPEQYNTLSENGKKAIEEKYNWQKEEHKLLSVYENLIT